jgi:hypothetical protein
MARGYFENVAFRLPSQASPEAFRQRATTRLRSADHEPGSNGLQRTQKRLTAVVVARIGAVLEMMVASAIYQRCIKRRVDALANLPTRARWIP